MEKIKKNALSIGGLIIGSAIIWGAVIIGCALVLRNTECYPKIQNILIGGTMAHLILIWGPMAVQLKKAKEKEKKEAKAE